MKKIISFISILIVILSFSVISNAASSTQLEITSSTKTVAPGETISLIVSIKETDITGGINAIEGEFQSESSVVESITLSSADSTTWSVNKSGTGNSFIITRNAVTESTQMMKMDVKIKSTAEEGETTVSLTDLLTSTSDFQDVEIDDVSYTFEVKKSTSTPSPSPSTSPTPSVSPSPSTEVDDGTNGNDEKDPTTADKNIPKAGKIVLSTLAITGILVAGTFAILYRKYKDVK